MTNTHQPTKPSTPLLDVRAVTKRYGDTAALRSISLHVDKGAIVCLLGPSGCGKTTLLRLIAGLEQADSGAICFDGQPIDTVPIHKRGFGLMFQEYALFPHRTVAENIAFGLRMQRLPRDVIASRVAEMLHLVGLHGYDQRRVYELSGGERQRVALARALAPSPRLLMLDEPLGALDRALRERLLDELRAILKAVNVSSIYVTHDQAEAYAIADWLVLLKDGHIAQQGPPEALYRHPASLFAARFLGHANLVEGTVQSSGAGTLVVETALGRLRVSDSAAVPAGTSVTVVIRPEAAEISAADTSGLNQIDSVVIERLFRGSHARVTVQHRSGQQLTFDLDGIMPVDVGEPVRLCLRAQGMSVILDREQSTTNREQS